MKTMTVLLCLGFVACSALSGATTVLHDDQGHVRYCDHIFGSKGEHEYAVCIREANQAGFHKDDQT
jgi:hypothetical protein